MRFTSFKFMLLSLLILAVSPYVNAKDTNTKIDLRTQYRGSDIEPDNLYPQVKLITSLGEITIELNRIKAPITVNNFLWLTTNKEFDNTIFHRVIKNFVVQGGGVTPEMTQKDDDYLIVNESGNGLSNDYGTIAMARTSDPHSATSQFFINLKDNDFLDKKNAPDGWGYCVFGEVTEGIDIVEKIGAAVTGNKAGHSDVPIETIVIDSVEILTE